MIGGLDAVKGAVKKGIWGKVRADAVSGGLDVDEGAVKEDIGKYNMQEKLEKHNGSCRRGKIKYRGKKMEECGGETRRFGMSKGGCNIQMQK